MSEERWYDDRGNLYEFLDWMESEQCFSAAEIVRIVEKPWKWTREYAIFRAWATESNPELREWLSEAVGGDRSAEEVIARFNEEQTNA